MFKIKNIFSEMIFIVYAVRNGDDDEPEFLIYDNGDWEWIRSWNYSPVE